MIRINQKVIKLIEQKYQIIKIIDLVDYDLNPESMANLLASYAAAEFANLQRLVVLHHDTDFYPASGSIGNTVYNFFRLCANYIIPIDKVIFLTNHYGIKDEIKAAAIQICNDDNVTVIYTAHWYDFPTDLQNNHSSDDINITNLYCCLNGQQRQHRVMTLCMLKEHDLLDNGIISYNFRNA